MRLDTDSLLILGFVLEDLSQKSFSHSHAHVYWHDGKRNLSWHQFVSSLLVRNIPW